MATIDQQFVEYIVKTLVNNPAEVKVERTIDERGVLLSLTVDPEDVGRVIGRRGVTAQAIRVLLRALGTKQDARFNLKIVNTDEEGGERRSDSHRAESHDFHATHESHAETPEDTNTFTDNHAGETSADEDEDEEAEEENNDNSSELAEKTRAELADYDDLDI